MIKRSIIAALLLFISGFTAQSQTAAFNIAVVMPESIEGLDEGQLSKIETKMLRVLESSGITGTGDYCNFVVYPKFEVYETNVVEGGMQNIVVTSVNLSLFIKQVDNNLVFSSITKSLKGSGRTKSLSLTNAIANLKVDDKELSQFVASGKRKIIQYYNDKCNSILANADKFAKLNDFQQAIALTAQIPEGTNCYASAQTKSLAFYKGYQNASCKEAIKQANISLASNDYIAALEYLSGIDPAAVCAVEMKALIKKIESKVTAEERRDYDLKVKMYNDEVSLEKQRVNAIRDIAVSYYKNRPAVNYNYIVR